MTWVLAAVCLVLAACAGPGSDQAVAQVNPTPVAGSPGQPEQAVAPRVPAAHETVGPSSKELTCTGPATQGGAVLCKTLPKATLELDGKPVAIADANGLAVIGLSRTQASPATISLSSAGGASPYVFASVEVIPRTDTVSKLTMECNKIAPQSAEEKHKAEVAWVKKDKALKIFSEPRAPIGFVKPVVGDFPLSSSFGATRTYEPKTKDCKPTVNVHNGTDIAVPTGTEIRAPMAGTVILADPELYYEGGCVFLDLGRGLVSVTMHMSRIDVKPGQVVGQGDLLGLSGATGRVTGPHLHWAIKYRNVLSDDRGTDIWLDPVLMMALQQPMVSPQ